MPALYISKLNVMKLYPMKPAAVSLPQTNAGLPASEISSEPGLPSTKPTKSTGKIANRIDGYRLLRDLSQDYGFVDFALLRLPQNLKGASYCSIFDLHSLSEIEMEMLDLEGDCSSDPILSHLMHWGVPYEQRFSSNDSMDLANGLLRHYGLNVCVAFNLPGLTMTRYAIAFFARKDTPENRNTGALMLDTLACFDRLSVHLLNADNSDEFDARDAAILTLTSQGLTSQQIAAELQISEHTVNANVAALIKRMGVLNRPQLIATAIRKGLIG
jgi:DNA-binding CsgD family transcriptional regulator